MTELGNQKKKNEKLRLTFVCEECSKRLKKPLLFEDNFIDNERTVLLCYRCYSWFVNKAGNVPEGVKPINAD